MLDKNEICNIAKKVISDENLAISSLVNRIDDNFAKACQILVDCKGHIVVVGIGKSGHIGSKIAATLASTGNPAFFVHPGEANHGDMGMITKQDVVLAISNSGTTREILSLLPSLKHIQVPIVSLTGNPASPLAKEATVNIDVSVDSEACPLGLVPTSSTTAALVMGDALAISLLQIRGFTAQDFALTHPGGNLGKRLLLKVADLMHHGETIPKVYTDTIIKDALIEMTYKRLGMTTIVDLNEILVGIFTDGDLRRTLDKNIDIHKLPISSLMTTNFKAITDDTLAINALEIMESYNITSLPIISQSRKILGIIHIHDILKSGILPIRTNDTNNA